MKKVGLIFPHQLYKESKVVHNCDVVYIIEEHLYFTQYKFHKQKLVLHRASMKYYADLISSDTTVKYIQSDDYQGIGNIFESLSVTIAPCNEKYRVLKIVDYPDSLFLQNKAVWRNSSIQL
ncbi:cryptochrome/photolyase family protein [Bacteroidia bacterium]|nr:cryptochrome/photolyase family protein [Bacteroidia bacterium]MDB9881988.1 cryptochrome/photolyase family protein [Bacteroidia bacterium]